MTGPLPFSPRFKIARKAVRDVLLGNRSHGRVFLQQIRKVDLQPFSRNRIPRSHRFKRSEEHTSELQSRLHLVCRLLLEKKKNTIVIYATWYLLQCVLVFSL